MVVAAAGVVVPVVEKELVSLGVRIPVMYRPDQAVWVAMPAPIAAAMAAAMAVAAGQETDPQAAPLAE